MTPGFAVPLATIWLYFVSVVYLRAYLGFFSAEHHWFDPSLLRLLGFSYPAILTATTLTVLYYVLVFNPESTTRRLWLAVYAMYAILIGGILIGDCIALVIHDVSRSSLQVISAVLGVGVMLGVPIWSRRNAARTDPSHTEVLSTIDEKKRRLRLKELADEFGVSNEEVTRQAEEASHELRAILDRAEASLARLSSKYLDEIAIAVCLLFLLFTVSSLGRITALRVTAEGKDNEHLGYVQDAPREPFILLFTDGTAALIARGDLTNTDVAFYHDAADLVLRLRTPSQAYILANEYNATETQLQLLSLYVQGHFLIHGSLPESLDEIEMPSSFANKPMTEDRWSTPIQYKVTAMERFVITSAGPDVEFGTNDDLTTHGSARLKE